MAAVILHWSWSKWNKLKLGLHSAVILTPMLWSGIEWDTGMSDPEHMEHMEAAEQEWERAQTDTTSYMTSLCVHWIRYCVAFVWLVMCIHTCTITAAGWVIFCSCTTAYKIYFDWCNCQVLVKYTQETFFPCHIPNVLCITAVLLAALAGSFTHPYTMLQTLV